MLNLNSGQRRSRNTGYPTPPARIPACGFPAPGSSIILTRAEVKIFTQTPDSFPPDWNGSVLGKRKPPVPA